MGDFEDAFGAGADAVDIIDRFSRQEARYARQEARPKPRTIKKASARIFFATYDEAIAWENERKGVPFIRRRRGEGYEVELVG